VLRRISTIGAAVIDGSAITIANTLSDTTWFQLGFITRVLLDDRVRSTREQRACPRHRTYYRCANMHAPSLTGSRERCDRIW
jgi:hypothetical protein